MIKQIFTLFLIMSFQSIGYAKVPIKIAFWNVENLFDLIDDPITNDDEYALGGRKNVTQDIYNLKFKNLSHVINKLDADVLGLCEVENRFILDELNKHLNRNYSIVHFDSKDSRGIDVALLVDESVVDVVSAAPINVPLPSGSPTRDILYATLNIHDVKTHVFVNHWPSKYGGVEKTIPLRAAAGKALRKEIDKILNLDSASEIIVMGDLNDEPTDPSVAVHLESSMEKEQLKKDPTLLWNLMSPWHRNPNGSTYKYGGNDMVYDHLLISYGLTDNTGLAIVDGSVGVFDGYDYRQHGGKYNGYPFRFWAGKRCLGGYSDHLPVYVSIQPNN